MPDTRRSGRWRAAPRFVWSACPAVVLTLFLPGPLQSMTQPVPQRTSYPILLVPADDSMVLPDASGVGPVAEDDLPANLVGPQNLKRLLLRMWRHSPTFRRQCARIRAEPRLRVRVYTATSISQSGGRAATHIHRGAAGILEADVHLAIARASEFTELLAHELEHIIEQLDGVDLSRLARLAPVTVWPTGNQRFETQRATQTGRLVAAEVEGRAH
jgi:hypothetical protein